MSMEHPTARLFADMQAELGRLLFGVEPVIHALCVALVARGHVLMQGPPGVGKTMLARNLAGRLAGSFRRIQGTADLMPADITGVHVYNQEQHRFEFQPGPVFADVLLVDEVNRASPRAQSALLEAMEERQVTVDRERFPLPADFLVIATQNPREFEGTYPLPESQLDRFMLRIELGYPDRAAEHRVLAAYGGMSSASLASETPAPLDAGLLAAARSEASALEMSGSLVDYALQLAAASRSHALISLGLSTRGALALIRGARVVAAARGAGFVGPDDLKAVAPLVMSHRLALTAEAVLEGHDERLVVDQLLASVPVPR